MNILVTGAGGFLGRTICQQLLQKNYKVYGLARGHYPDLEEKGVLMHRLDITDEKNFLALNKVWQGVKFGSCIHTAGKVDMWGKWDDFYSVNVVGTQNTLTFCKENSIRYFIYTSSPSVIFGGESIKNGDESLPYPKKYYGLYGRSKAIAEQEVLKANSNLLKTVCLRPHLIFGKGDKNIIPRIVELGQKGRLKIVGDGQNQVDVVHVKNAAEAHLLALNKLKQGEDVDGKVFFIGQGPVFLWPFINKILGCHGVPPIQKKISFKKAFLLGYIVEVVLCFFRIYNRHPLMTRFLALQLGKSHYFNHKEANQALGWYPKIDIDEALDDI